MNKKIKIRKLKGRNPWLAWHPSCALSLPPGEYTACASSTHEGTVGWAIRHQKIHERAGR